MSGFSGFGEIGQYEANLLQKLQTQLSIPELGAESMNEKMGILCEWHWAGGGAAKADFQKTVMENLMGSLTIINTKLKAVNDHTALLREIFNHSTDVEKKQIIIKIKTCDTSVWQGKDLMMVLVSAKWSFVLKEFFNKTSQPGFLENFEEKFAEYSMRVKEFLGYFQKRKDDSLNPLSGLPPCLALLSHLDRLIAYWQVYNDKFEILSSNFGAAQPAMPYLASVSSASAAEAGDAFSGPLSTHGRSSTRFRNGFVWASLSWQLLSPRRHYAGKTAKPWLILLLNMTK
jgi:hypothetical protein